MAGSYEPPERTPEFYEHIMQRDQDLILEQAAEISWLKFKNNQLREKLDNRNKKAR